MARPGHLHRDLSRARRLHAERGQLRLEGRGGSVAGHRLKHVTATEGSRVVNGQSAGGRHLPSRVAGRRAPNLVATIEGTIVATAVVAGLDESDSVSPPRALWVLLATGAFFWIAHVYADLLAGRIQGHHRMRRRDVTRCCLGNGRSSNRRSRSQCPSHSVRSAYWMTGSRSNLAWLVGVAALVGWGIVFARREGHGLAGVVGAASLNASVGLVIIVLKVAVR